MTARLLMIAIDGADGPLLDRYTADGTLPHLSALRARGRAHRLSVSPGSTDDAIWASFQYEVDAGEHGRYHYLLRLSDGRMGMPVGEEDDRRTFWDDLSSRGMRVAVIDVPKSRDPRPINGIHLVDWLVHGRYFEKPRSQPPALTGEILERFGPAPPSRCGYEQPLLRDGEVRDIVRNLRTGVAQKRAAGVHYLASEPWDLFVIAFKEAHCAGHAFWDFDGGHPGYDPRRHARLGDPLLSVLRDIDNAVADLIAAAGPSAEVVVFSTTEFEPNGGLNHLMPEIVERLNVRITTGDLAGVDRTTGTSGLSAPSSDWRCAILPYNENCAALRVTRSSETVHTPNGRPAVLPDSIQLQAIEMELRSLRDADTGRPVVSAVTRPSSELKGSKATTLPDLLAHYVSGIHPRAVTSPTLGRVETKAKSRGRLLKDFVRGLVRRPLMMRPGNHAGGGFVIAAGTLAAPAIAEVRTMAGFGSIAKIVLGQSSYLPQSALAGTVVNREA